MPTLKGTPTIFERLDEIGIDVICERIQNLESMTDIAHSLGIRLGKLREWICIDPRRSARAREARASTAAAYDDEALRRLDSAGDNFELAKAKEIAHHLRWRASKIAPEYGDKQTIEHRGSVALLNEDQRRARLAELTTKMLGAPLITAQTND